MLKQYDEVLPGAAERILKMAEEQSTHRKQLERKVIDGDDTESSGPHLLLYRVHHELSLLLISLTKDPIIASAVSEKLSN